MKTVITAAIMMTSLARVAVALSVTIVWVDANPTPPVTYTVNRADKLCDLATAATDYKALVSGLTVKTYTDNTILPAGDYCFQVVASHANRPDRYSAKAQYLAPLDTPVITIQQASVIVVPWSGVVKELATGAVWPAVIPGITRDCKSCKLSTGHSITWGGPAKRITSDISVVSGLVAIVDTVPSCEHCPNLPRPTCLADYIKYPSFPAWCVKQD